MQVPVFKSLAKPVYWCGLPRSVFFSIILLTIVAFFFFKTIYVAVPVIIIYFVLRLLVREDRRIFDILVENFHLKSHYFPD